MNLFKLDRFFLLNRKKNPYITVYSTIELSDIIKSIELFNSEIFWDKMYDVKIAKNRINSNHQKFYVGIYKDNMFGYFWLKSISKNEYLIHNVFSKKEPVKREYGATDMIYEVLLNLNSGIFYAEIDEWNTKSQRVFEKLGFVKCEENSYIPNQWE